MPLARPHERKYLRIVCRDHSWSGRVLLKVTPDIVIRSWRRVRLMDRVEYLLRWEPYIPL